MNGSATAIRVAGRRIAILATLAVLGWASVRNVALTSLGETRPTVAMAFAPAGAAALANAALTRVIAAGGTVDAVARAQTEQALTRAPRDAAPLILAGLAASADGAGQRAQALMEGARARDPRAGIARYWLLDHYVRTDQPAEALAEVGPALRLRPGTREAIFALVSAMAAQPATRPAVRDALARDPDWRESFFATQATANVDPRGLIALLRSLPPPADPAAAARERRGVLLAGVRAGAYAEAQALWRATLPLAWRGAGPVHDPTFRLPFGDMPFGWNAPTAPGLLVQPGGDGVRIAYRGDTPVTVLEQLIVGEGRFRLMLRGTGAGVVARLSCARDEAPLGSVTLSGEALDVAVPPGCGAAWLKLIALPAEEGADGTARVTDLRLTRA